MHQITRVFHPVGQGAFYSERHTIGDEKFNIVYDCGSLSSKIDSVVQDFADQNEIDVLFISHFDQDHVNKIKLLQSKTIIKRVVLPLLHDDERILLEVINKVLGYNEVVTLIDSPEQFFKSNDAEKPKTQITKVNINRDSSDIQEPQTINLLKEVPPQIDSGTSLVINHDDNHNWVFIPYNFDFSNRRTEIEREIVSAGYTVDSFKNMVDNSIFDAQMIKKKINSIYKKLSGTMNSNSMFLYSGPNSTDKYTCFCDYTKQFARRPYYFDCHKLSKVGCLYTGDGNFNELIDIKKILPNHYKYLGVIQTPHHGSKNSFNINFVSFYGCRPILFITCYGSKNQYGHPSANALNEIINNGYIPVLVTEDEKTKFSQDIIIYLT